MSAYTTNKEEKPAVSVPIVVGSIVLLMIFIGGFAYKSFAPQGPVPVKTATSEWLEKLARESGGDFAKLSPADQAKLNQFPPGGQGAKWLKRKYDSLHKF